MDTRCLLGRATRRTTPVVAPADEADEEIESPELAIPFPVGGIDATFAHLLRPFVPVIALVLPSDTFRGPWSSEPYHA